MTAEASEPRDLGGLVRAGRRAKRWSQVQLAAVVGVHPTELSRIECGHRVPGADLVQRLADALDVPTDEFVRRLPPVLAAAGPGDGSVSEADDEVDDVDVVRVILREHHLLPNPTGEQILFALELVWADPHGSRALAFGHVPPAGREDVLTAPALGVYLPAIRPVEATPEAIRGMVAREYNVDVDAMCSLELVPEHTWPREVGMFLASRRTDASEAEIANVFGRRRPATVSQSCGAVGERIRVDTAAANAVARLDAAIRPPRARPDVGE